MTNNATNPLRLGIVGVGHLGKIHLRCALATDAWQVAGFYDPNDAVADSVVQTFGIQRFRSLAALFEAVDAIDVITPTQQHYDIAARALRAGRHVFIEKPVTQTVAQARRLLRLAHTTGLTVQVGHVERFNPAFGALAGIQLTPMFIESHRLAAFQPRGTDVSVVLDLMIHDLDLVLHLVQSKVRSVHASGVAVLSHTPDIANARIEFDNGAVANLTASRMSLKQMRKMRIFQPDAYLSLDFLEKQTQIMRLHIQQDPTAPASDNWMVLDTPSGQKWLELQMPEAPPINAIQRELETFADSIRQGTPPVVTLADGVAALELAHRILRSMEAGRKRSVLDVPKFSVY
jgi:predicted dehydrogenase